MGKVHERIDDRLRGFLERQHVFFVGTAPTDPRGRVNVSPKGIGGTLAVVDDHTVAYLDITASGAETIAHLRENGRITLMFCAFDGPPNVVRLHGVGRVVTLYDEEYDDWAAYFASVAGARAVVVVDVERISDSCGYGVPSTTGRASVTCYRRTWSERVPAGRPTTGAGRTAPASTVSPPSTTTLPEATGFLPPRVH